MDLRTFLEHSTLDEKTTRRFWLKIHFTKDCWLWTANICNEYGYGGFSYQSKRHFAHRISFLMKNGHFPEGVTRHTCDTARCVNWDHLLEGTHQQNTQDMLDRGRHRKRVLGAGSKLNMVEVAAIRELRASGVSNKFVADLYGVSPSCVSGITSGRNWGRVA